MQERGLGDTEPDCRLSGELRYNTSIRYPWQIVNHPLIDRVSTSNNSLHDIEQS